MDRNKILHNDKNHKVFFVEFDRQTDTQTNYNGIYHASIASRGKN